MLNLGGEKLLVVLVIALVVLGPERLPEVARKLGNIIRQVKAMSAGFETEVRKAIDIDGIHQSIQQGYHEATHLGYTPFRADEARIEAAPSPDTSPVDQFETDIRPGNNGPSDEHSTAP